MVDDVENGQLPLRTGWTGQNPPKVRANPKNTVKWNEGREKMATSV